MLVHKLGTLWVGVWRGPSHRNASTLINGCGYKITSTSFRFKIPNPRRVSRLGGFKVLNPNEKKPYGLAMPILRTYYTILYCTILYCTILYCIVLYCTVIYYTILYYTLLYCTVLYCNILYYTVLYYTVLYFTVLYCTVL